MEFYLGKIDSIINSSTPFNNNLVYEVSLNSTYDKLSYRGVTNESDTAGFILDYKEGQFSISIITDTAGMEENFFPLDIKFEKPWELDCRFYFYPRDTGAGDLAIGFIPADTMWGENPEGLIVLNRDNYQIKSIYLHYLVLDDYEWLSREYHFSYDDGTTYLSSLVIQGCYYGFFQRRYFRQNLEFENYDLQ